MAGLGAAAVIAGACSLGGIDSEYGQLDAGPQPTDAQVQSCAALASARCRALSACNDNAQIPAAWGTLAACQVRLAHQCELDLLAPDTGATTATTDTCTQQLERPDADCVWTNNTEQYFLEPEVCEPVQGGLAVGTPCFTSAQCQSGYCSMAATAQCGMCEPLPVVGTACTDRASCGYGTHLGCLQSACVVTRDAGAPCMPGGTTLCGLGLACTKITSPAAADAAADGDDAGDDDADVPMDADTDVDAHACIAEGTVAGQPCDPKDFGSPTCNNGLFCIDGACTPVTYADAGSACGSLVTGAAPTQCLASGQCGGNTCAAAVPDGQRCSATTSCIPPARCVLSTGSTEGICAFAGGTQCP